MTTATLVPIVKTRFAHRLRQDGTGQTLPRKECWEAKTKDGVWVFERIDGEPGTPWAVVHFETGTDVDWQTSLRRCREYVARGWAAEALERIQAHKRGEHTERVPACRRC
jgi:hypothetical protein